MSNGPTGFSPGYSGVDSGFSFGSLFSNPMVLQMMASLGGSMDPEGPAGAIGGVANQWIQNQSYLKMMKSMLGGGAKMTLDKDKFSFGGPTSALSGAFGTGGMGDQFQEDQGMLSLANEGAAVRGDDPYNIKRTMHARGG